jgi:hypothetical protein
MFLRNEDFYQLRRISLSDLLDNQSALQLTNKLLIEAKRKLYKLIKGGDIVTPAAQPKGKKRSKKDAFGQADEEILEETDDKIIQEFAHESEIKDLYEVEEGFQSINVEEQLGEDKLYVAIGVKSLLASLDLKKEVVSTMLN